MYNMKKIIRLTESDIRRLVKESVNRILREGMFDNPLNQTDIDDEPIEDYDDDITPEAGMNGLDGDYISDDDSLYGGNDLNGFGYTPSASDFDDVPSEDEFNDFSRRSKFMNDYGDEDFDSMPFESKKIIGRALRESINKVLKEKNRK